MESINLAKVGVEQAATQAVATLRSGKLLIYPTDTVYGIGADAQNETAVNRVRTLKGRDPLIPLSVVMRDFAMVSEYCEVTPVIQALLEKHLPGAFTFILKLKDTRIKTSDTGKVGVRIPQHELVNRISAIFERPYVATSANISHTPPLTTISEILETFGKGLGLGDSVIDAGTLLDLPSTVVDLTAEHPTIIRKGVGIFTE